MKRPKLLLYTLGFLGIFAWYLYATGTGELEIIFADITGSTPETSEIAEIPEVVETPEVTESRILLFQECEGFVPGRKLSGPALALSGSVVLVSSNHRDTYGCAVAVLLDGYTGLLQGNLCRDGFDCGLEAKSFLKGLLTQKNSITEIKCKNSHQRRLSILEDTTRSSCSLPGSEFVIAELPVMSCSSWKHGNLSQAMVISGWGLSGGNLDLVPFQGVARKQKSGIWAHGGIGEDPEEFLIQEISRIAKVRDACDGNS